MASEAKIGRATRLCSRWWPSSDAGDRPADQDPLGERHHRSARRRTRSGAACGGVQPYTPRPCTSSSSDAGGWARRSAAPSSATGTPSPSSTGAREAFARLGADFAGTTVQGIGFDRDRLIEAGIEEAGAVAAVTSGDNSNILVARVARENFGIDARRRPHLRPAAGRRSTSASGSRPSPPVAWTTDQVLRRLIPEATPAEWIDPTAKVCLVDRSAPRRLGRPPDHRARGGGRRPGRRHQPDGRGDDPDRPHRRPGRRRAVPRRRGRPPRRGRRRPAGAGREGALTCAS